KSREGTSVAGVKTTPTAETPAGPDHSPFDFPLFKIPVGSNEHEPSPFYTRTLPIIHKPAFKPPTVLPDGRVGYPLSPTTPPKLPSGTGGEPLAGSGGAGVSKHAERPTARIDEADAEIVADGDNIKQDRPATSDAGEAKDKDSPGEESPDSGEG